MVTTFEPVGIFSCGFSMLYSGEQVLSFTYMAQNLHHFPPIGICYLLYGIGNSW